MGFNQKWGGTNRHAGGVDQALINRASDLNGIVEMSDVLGLNSFSRSFEINRIIDWFPANTSTGVIMPICQKLARLLAN
jgi:hypothetical protein